MNKLLPILIVNLLTLDLASGLSTHHVTQVSTVAAHFRPRHTLTSILHQNSTQVAPVPVVLNQTSLPVNTTNPTTAPTQQPHYLPKPPPTTSLPNPQQNLTEAGQSCANKCRELRGISCKKWKNNEITCCQFTGCQWPFYCLPEKRIMVQGCVNKE